MPGPNSHFFLGDALLNSYENFTKENISFRQAFNLGCQGPDIFFYNKKLYIFGNNFHRKHISEPIKHMYEFANLQNDNIKELLQCYIKGYLTHHSFDSVAHPYIFFVQFKELERRQLSDNFSPFLHRYIEALIDITLARFFLKDKIKDFRPFKCIETSNEVKIEISKMYSYVFNKMYEMNTPIKKILFCFNIFELSMKFIYSPLGIKKAIVKQIEHLFRIPHLYSPLFFSLKEENLIDIMNEGKNSWHNPLIEEIKLNKTFYELFNDAIIRAKEEIKLFNNSKYNFNAFEITKGICMDTGLKVDIEIN